MSTPTNYQVFMNWATLGNPQTNKSSGLHYSDFSQIESSVCVSPLAVRAENSIIINGDLDRPHGMGHNHHNVEANWWLDRDRIPHITIPFSALALAFRYLNTPRNPLETAYVLDSRPDDWHTICPHTPQHVFYECPTPKTTHQLGGSLIGVQADGQERYLLSGFDSTQRVRAYCLMLLPQGAAPHNMGEAYTALMPGVVQERTASEPEVFSRSKIVDVAYHSWCRSCQRERHYHQNIHQHTRTLTERGWYGGEVRRQGEWWFVPEGEDAIYSPDLAHVTRNTWLPAGVSGTQSHTASYTTTDLVTGELLVRGQITHRRREHFTTHLGKKWHRAFINTAEQSWTVVGQSGRVD